MLKITSASNNQYKQWKKLLNRKGRKEFNQFLIEGEHLVQMALSQEHFQVEAILFLEESHPLAATVSERKIKAFHLDKALFEELMTTQTPQAIAAVVRIPKQEEPESLLGQWKRLLLLDRIQDPGNLGTIIRTADAAGVDAILCQTGTVDVFNDKAIRSTQGSLFHIPVYYVDLEQLVDNMKQMGWFIIGSSLQEAIVHYDLELPADKQQIALMVGNEGEGVAETLLIKTDINLKIPIYGQAESLNVAIAAGIMLYEIGRRDRNED